MTTRVFIPSITDEFILGLNIIHNHDVSVDLRHHELQLGNEEVLFWCPQARPKLASCMNDYIEVASVRYARVAAVHLGGSLEAVDSPGMGYRAAHHAEVRTPVQLSRKMPVRITEDCCLQ
jgi:hypothetical protein